MDQTPEQAAAKVAPAASADTMQVPRTARPRWLQASPAWRAAVALASSVVSLALLGAVMLGLTSQPKQPNVARQSAGKPADKGAAESAGSVTSNADPL